MVIGWRVTTSFFEADNCEEMRGEELGPIIGIFQRNSRAAGFQENSHEYVHEISRESMLDMVDKYYINECGTKSIKEFEAEIDRLCTDRTKFY
jgi:hypothetical protein